MCSFLGQRTALRRYLGHLEFLASAFLNLSGEALRHFDWLDSGISIQRSGIFILFLAFFSVISLSRPLYYLHSF